MSNKVAAVNAVNAVKTMITHSNKLRDGVFTIYRKIPKHGGVMCIFNGDKVDCRASTPEKAYRMVKDEVEKKYGGNALVNYNTINTDAVYNPLTEFHVRGTPAIIENQAIDMNANDLVHIQIYYEDSE